MLRHPTGLHFRPTGGSSQPTEAVGSRPPDVTRSREQGEDVGSGSGGPAVETLTQREAASRLGIAPKTLKRRADAGDISRHADGTFPWPAVRDELEGEGLSQTEAASRLGITDRHLRTLTRDGKVTRSPDRTYPWPAIQVEYDAFLAEADDRRAAGFGGESYEEARRRLTEAKADAAEMENQLQRRELLDARDVEALVREPLERVNLVLRNAPTKYAPRLARAARIRSPEAKRLLAEIVAEVRAELRRLGEVGGAAA